jgi:glutamine amidotransferase
MRAHTASELDSADRIVLPGLGHLETGVAELRQLQVVKPIRAAALRQGKPILGICLGM